MTNALSAARPSQRAPARSPETNDGQTAPILLFVIGALLLFLLVRNGTDVVVQKVPALAPLWLVIIPAPAAAFYWVTFATFETFMRRFAKAGALFLIFYFATEPFAVPHAALGDGHPAVLFHQYGRWLGVALGLAAWFRPAALYAGAMVLWFMRDLNTPITGFGFSNLDIRNVVEVLAFVGAGFTLIAATRQSQRLQGLIGLSAHGAKRAALLILAIGVGGHFGNYFYSALAKLALDGGVFSWLLDNRLYDGLPGAMEKGTYPFAAWPALGQFVYDAVKALNLPLHLVSFAAQFAAIVAIFRRKWIMGLTVVYDLFHLSVYLTYGLFFWKWVVLNAVILATLAAVPDAWWTRSARFAGAAAVLFGAIFFKTATLAWYDSPGFMSVYFEAEMQDGARVRVPSSYFHSASYQVSHGKFYAPPSSARETHFNFSIWGSVLRKKDVEAGRACAPPQHETPSPAQFGPLEAMSAYIAAHHAAALAKAGPDGRYRPWPYIHHHLPSPLVKTPFDAVRLSDIKTYHYVAESVCLGLENGRLQRDVIARSEFPVFTTAEATR